MLSGPQEQVLEQPKLEEKTSELRKIILWNDEVNTFDWVIESLVKVCEHTPEQAEQSAHIVHYKGKYAVKIGSLEDLKPRCEALLDRKLTATIQ